MNASNTNTDDFSQIEQWLVEAGIAYTVVDACPRPRGEVCRPSELSAAA